jgi:hypothetical protein
MSNIPGIWLVHLMRACRKARSNIELLAFGEQFAPRSGLLWSLSQIILCLLFGKLG